jgi:hypothetical protein
LVPPPPPFGPPPPLPPPLLPLPMTNHPLESLGTGRDRYDPVRSSGSDSSLGFAPRRSRRRRNWTRMPTGTESARRLHTTTNVSPSPNLHVWCEPFVRMGLAPRRRSSSRRSRQLLGSRAARLTTTAPSRRGTLRRVHPR